MIAKDNPIKASDLDNSLISIERTVTRTNTETEPSGDQYSYKAKLIETRTPTSSGEGSPVLYTTSNIQDSGGVVSNSTESGPTKDLVTVSDFKSSIATKASSSHSHSLSDVKEFAGWSITQKSSKDIVFKVRSPKRWTLVSDSKFGTSAIQGICYGNGKFVAVGYDGKMAYSYDGINWTAVSDSKFGTSVINGVCYGNGKFVAAGNDGKIAYSSDGINWTAVTNSGFDTKTIRGVCYGNGKFVAVSSSSNIAYSSDGISWTQVPVSGLVLNSDISGICYGNGKFVAVSFGGKMAYSFDGATWTLISDPKFGGNSIYGIGYGNGKFVAVGVLGKMAYSEVGTGWTAGTNSGFNTDTYTVIYGVCYGNGKFVAVGGDVRLVKERIAYSSDGINWTAVPDLNLDSGIPYSVCYGNGKFVAGGHLGKIAYSEVFH